MALIIQGQTKCPLCNQIIEKDDEIESFPSFLPFDHKFGKFSDAAFHKSCFLANPDYEMVSDMYMAYCMISNSRPKDLQTIEEIEAWNTDAFRDWPPKNGVVIFQPIYPDEDTEGFYMDIDDYNAMCEAEDKAYKEFKEGLEEAHKRDMESLQYVRDD